MAGFLVRACVRVFGSFARRSGIVRPVLAALDAHFSVSSVQHAGLLVLWNLTEDEATAVKVRRTTRAWFFGFVVWCAFLQVDGCMAWCLVALTRVRITEQPL